MSDSFLKINRLANWLLLALLAGLFIWQAGFKTLDPDLGWHLKFGSDIAASGHLPRDQTQLWSVQGDWVDHEWLSDWLNFQLYQHTGYVGLTALWAFIVLAVVFLLWRQLKPRSAGADLFVALWLMLGLASLYPHLGPRPQQLSWLFLAILLLLLRRLTRRARWRETIAVIVLLWFWSAMHGSFVIGLAILALWSGQELWLKHRSKKHLALPLTAGLGGLAATFLTPYGWSLYDFLLTYRHGAYLRYISEWKAIWVWPLNYWQLLAMATLTAITLSWLIFKPRPPLPLWLWLTDGLLLIMSVISARHWPLAFVAVSLTLVAIFKDLNWPLATERSSRAVTAIQLALPWLLTATVWWTAVNLVLFRDPWMRFCGDYPCQTTAWLKNQPRYSRLKLLNHYNYGGWLIWLWPDKSLFIDGRLPQYPLNGHSLLEDYFEFEDSAKLAGKLDSLQIDAVLWRDQAPDIHLNWLDKFLGFNETALRPKRDELKQFLDNSPNWRRVVSDQASVLYIRKNRL